MDSATGRNNGSPKRTRITDPSITETRPGQLPTKAPLSIAIAFVEDTASKSLQVHIAPILSTLASNHCRTMAKIHNKRKQVEKMQADDELIPRSARVKFEFQVSKETSTNLGFLAIKAHTQELVIAFRKALKAQIIATTKIEISLAEQTALTDFCRSLRSSCNTFIVAEDANQVTPDLVANTVIARHGASILRYFPGQDIVSFREIYKVTHGLATLPNPEPQPRLRPALRAQAPAAAAEVHDFSDSLALGILGMEVPVPVRIVPIPPGPAPVDSIDYPRLFRIFQSLFVDSWTAYLNQSKMNATNLQLKKLYVDTFTTKATEATAMELDAELPKDRGQLNELIRKSTAEATDKLKKELQAIKDAIGGTSKNTGRRGQPGASSNKKQIKGNENPRPTKRSQSRSSNPKQADQKQQGKAKADDAANASSSESKNLPGNRSRGKSPKKNTASKTKRRTPSKRSTSD
jgi:hypothetical protein